MPNSSCIWILGDRLHIYFPVTAQYPKQTFYPSFAAQGLFMSKTHLEHVEWKICETTAGKKSVVQWLHRLLELPTMW